MFKRVDTENGAWTENTEKEASKLVLLESRRASVVASKPSLSPVRDKTYSDLSEKQ